MEPKRPKPSIPATPKIRAAMQHGRGSFSQPPPARIRAGPKRLLGRESCPLKPVSARTEVNIEQKDIPAVIPPEARYPGWQQSLMQLALVVEPDIPG